MNTVMKSLCVAVIAIAFGVGTSAFADTLTFTSPSGALGNTQTYTLAGQTITASGFCSGSACALFGKTMGGNESGLGLAGDPSGNDEIFVGTGTFIQLDLSALISAGITTVSFVMGSTTGADAWAVFACPTGGTLCSNMVASGNDQLVLHTLTGLTTGTEFLDFTATGGNVLISSLSASAVPEPSSLLLVGSGILGLAGVVRRKLNR